MTTARTLFPGAMGPEGFISCFDHLMDDALLRRKLILKGGPGVGKSTFMRRVHAALCANGEPSTLYFCSGDPDSLDGVAVPHAGLLILDGTAPHIVDPEIPGARDSIINLGECLNEPAMRLRLSPIRACMADNAACSRRARACLAAAAALARENAAILQSAADTERLFRMTQALTQAVLVPSAPTESAPGVRPVITEAMTPEGRNQPDCRKRAVPRHPSALPLGHGRHARPSAAQRRRARGRIQHGRTPLPHRARPPAPRRHSGVVYPCHHERTAHRRTDLRLCRLYPAGALLRHECALEQGRAGIQLHLHRAGAALAQAKELHDELESFYVPNMDFAKWQTILDRTLESLK